MRSTVIYIHGKGGSADEAEHYKTLFPDSEVIGLDYKAFTPWETGKEINAFINSLEADRIILIANSIGAFFTMNADIEQKIYKAYFISPIVNMEKLICDMMMWAGVTENELKEKGKIDTDSGETLDYEYLTYVRNHKPEWNVPTRILYGEKDNLTSFETISTFAKEHHFELTVMPEGEHWFHTAEQMNFLDKWIKG